MATGCIAGGCEVFIAAVVVNSFALSKNITLH